METSVGGCSLGDLVDLYLNSQAPESGIPGDIVSKPWTKLANWNRFSWVMRSKEHGPTFRDLFTDSQRHSSQLIQKWMDENDQNHEALFRSPILTGESELRENETDDQLLGGSVDFKEIIYPDRAGTIPGYDQSIQELAQCEFYSFPKGLKRSNYDQKRLNRVRKTAILKDYCYRIATHCYKDGVYSGSPGSLEDGPSLKSCPWLDEKPLHKDGLNGWPQFLFDVEAGRTVETKNLDGFPAYSAISHTWGRWREHGNPPVKVEGVRWSIPPNTQFDVQAISNSLRKCNCNTKYIWLDLVCIPQDGSEIAVQEIGRQADIFRNASRAIAWLHDVDDLSCLRALCRWLALSLLLFESGSSEASRRDKMRDKEWANIAHKPSGLLMPTRKLDTPSRELNPWFTSLWTLQELCLRPDMLLASSDLEILSMDWDLRVPINALILVFNEFHYVICSGTESNELHRNYGETHFALDELSRWSTFSGLGNLFELRRIDIFTLGDQRECDMRRSEAIMSALGMTEWFHQTPREQHESNLVLGKYHPAFVEEVRRTIPGEFFGDVVKTPDWSLNGKGLNNAPLENPFEFRDDAQVPIADIKQYQWATLLPFSTFNAIYLQGYMGRFLSFQSHDTLLSWEIRQSGEVHITKVCLLSSSTQEVATQSAQLPCAFHGFFTSIPKVDTDLLHFELNQWVRTRSYEVHAVVTSFEDSCFHGTLVAMARSISGVVLRKLDDGSFFKIGNFWVSTPEPVALPDVLEVDWTVI